MISVYAHNMWRCSGSGKLALVCVLLLRNKRTGGVSNYCVITRWKNPNIDVVDGIHGYTTVVHWEECRNQSVCVCLEVCAIRLHRLTQSVSVDSS